MDKIFVLDKKYFVLDKIILSYTNLILSQTKNILSGQMDRAKEFIIITLVLTFGPDIGYGLMQPNM